MSSGPMAFAMPVAVCLLTLGVGSCLVAASSQAESVEPGIGHAHLGDVIPSRSIHAMAPRDAALAVSARNPPLGLPRLRTPPEQKLIDLGRRLFFDRRLSANDTLSCGMCHVPEQAFTQNELATPVGISGAAVLRNAPSLYNVAYRQTLFHDGRAASLEDQIWAPLLADNEMGNASQTQVIEKVLAISSYRSAFAGLFDSGLTAATLGAALAAYQRALLSANSPFDRWYFGGEESAVNDQVKAGFAVFLASGCGSCHQLQTDSALFTDDQFHNTGAGFAAARSRSQEPLQVQLAPGRVVKLDVDLELPERTDSGREAVSGNSADHWKFRTPSLRNVALTAPYMHDGSLLTLSEVISFYDLGGGGDPAQDPRVRPLALSAGQRQALLQFLLALTGDNTELLAADARTAAIGER